VTTAEDVGIERDRASGGGPGGGVEHFDVLVVGAGISGIGVAYHLAHRFPAKSFTVLESRADFGGTWTVNRFPGARSDSDMYTFGYSFKPWLKDELATAEQILAYLSEVIDENGLGQHIRYRRRVTSARWSSAARQWSVEVTRLDTGEQLRCTADFLWMCQGYYRQDEGYTPQWPGIESFRGPIVHSLTWPEDLDYAGKRVVVIGSGATAATLVPAMAGNGAAHVTMLQRSPTYYIASPKSNEIAETLRSVDTPAEWTHEIVRRLILKQAREARERRASAPEEMREWFIDQARRALPPGYDVDRHFTPRYPLGRQRICRIPDGDFFTAISEGKASVVTDTIQEFTEHGIRLSSGETLEADIVVTATGFHLSVMGDIPFFVDGQPVDWASTVTYHGIMFTGVPNLAYIFGYWRSSWTLRVDLISDLVGRLLEHMDERGATVVVPALRDGDADMPLRPWTDPDDFNPGYLLRSIHRVPRQGDRMPWRGTDVGYFDEREILPAADFGDGTLTFS
jgi:cation diffusion facilitator CzcD-associated flavoprotein CzcO